MLRDFFVRSRVRGYAMAYAMGANERVALASLYGSIFRASRRRA
jgi:hypothetical protein